MAKPRDGRDSASHDSGEYRYESAYSDRELGMHKGISRRDFLDGFALSMGAAAVGGSLFGAAGASAHGQRASRHWDDAYPPHATGLTGSDPDALRTLEALVRGKVDTEHARDTGEHYDLVVVGAGISGLSAAYFYLRDVDADARILILDPHDDFGGHARRNEFVLRDHSAPGAYQTKVTNAGSQSMDHVASETDGWTQHGFAAAKQMLDELGVDYQALAGQTQTPNPYTEAGATGSRVMWLKEIWGGASDIKQTNLSTTAQIAGSQLDPVAKQQLPVVLSNPPDWLAGKTPDEKIAALKLRTAAQALADFAPDAGGPFAGGLHPQVLQYLESSPIGGTGLPYSLAPALDGAVWAGTAGLGGLRAGLDLSKPVDGVRKTAVLRWTATGGTLRFPDGNAGIARHLVRRLVPGSIPGTTTADLTLARCDYSKLDRSGNRVRIRLQSTVVRVEHVRRAKHEPKRIELRYVDHRSGKLNKVRAGAVFFGCWNAFIPHIAPELPAPQREGLADAVKMPMLYLRVGLSNWKAWQAAGINSVSYRDGYWTGLSLDGARAIGGYQSVGSPEQPVLLNASKGFTRGGHGSAQEGARAGQRELIRTSFRDFERSVRDYLVRALGDDGFEPERDIAAIAVNRWPYGYMRYYHLPNDAAFWKDFGPNHLPPPGRTPADVGTAPHGRLTFGTTDAYNHGFCESSILKAYEAAQYYAASA